MTLEAGRNHAKLLFSGRAVKQARRRGGQKPVRIFRCGVHPVGFVRERGVQVRARWTHRLEELEQCGFVRRYGCARGMTVRSHVLSFLFIETADALMVLLV